MAVTLETIGRSYSVLEARLLELEHECADARDRAALLQSLQRAFTALALIRSEDAVIAAMLRAAYSTLGFTRALYFGVEPERKLCERFALDGSITIEANESVIEIRDGSAFAVLLHDPAIAIAGRGSELSAPLVDTRGWYVATALAPGRRIKGILYVDGHSSVHPREWEAELIRALATISAVHLENVALLAQMQELASRDPLTGLYNRRAFEERFRAEVETARRHGRCLAYIMIDVDDFKGINDAMGHAQGDSVLRTLGLTLQRNSRPQDVVARYAGDEFVVLLVDVEAALARTLVERLSIALREAGLRCSLGAALLPGDAADTAELMSRADDALYATKARGKNGFSFALPNRIGPEQKRHER